MHYHVTINGTKQRLKLESAEQARAALVAAVDLVTTEWENRGHAVTGEPVPNGVMVRWNDGVLSGWKVFEHTACAGDDCEQIQAARMTIRDEVWPLSADAQGIWLVSGTRPWVSGDIRADQDEHEVVESILEEHHARGAAKIIHSTSWRPSGTCALHSWVAMLCCPDVHDHWPGAQPVSMDLLGAVGYPAPHAADDVPLPRDIDVLFHAVRHLSFLLAMDGEAAAQMPEVWKRHLRSWEPALAGMYVAGHSPEVLAVAG